MNRDRIQQHLRFLREDILDNVSGQYYTYMNGKNKVIRTSAERKLDNGCNYANRYLERNPDLFDFMVAHHGCEPAFLEYPQWNHIEKDSAEYIRALEELLANTPE